MATAEELRRQREETSVFSRLFDYVRQNEAALAAEGRRSVLGGLLSKEPVMGTDTIRYEGIRPMLAGLLDPVARGIDAPRAAAEGLIPAEDMIREAMGTAGVAMGGGGAVARPAGALGSNSVRGIVEKYPEVDIDIYGDASRGYELSKIKVPEGSQGGGIGSKVMDDLIAAADAEGAQISLTPDTTFGGSSVSRLKDFYKRFGFVENKGRNKDFSTRNTMYRDPLMANASKSAGFLGVAADVADRGDSILNMLKSGRGSDVTDDMLDMGDNVKNTQLNQYLFDNYDLPMDEASRMSRAREMGLVDDQYHATPFEFRQFMPSQTGLSGRGVYTGDDPSDILDYARVDSDSDLRVIPVKAPSEKTLARNIDFQNTIEADSDFPYNASVDETVAGFKRAADTLSDQGYSGVYSQAGERVTFDPSNIRSRFARFDPRLSHLSNLTAANASPTAGLLSQAGMSEDQAERTEQALRRMGLLD